MCTPGTQKTIYVLCIFGYYQLFSQTDSIRIKKTDSLELSIQTPVFTDSQADDTMEEQELNSLLTSSRDVFVQFATFQFGSARYKIRGASAKDQLILMNGINMANPETGFASWGNWGGLNDITRFTDNQVGNTINVYGFSTHLGYVHIDAKASAYRKGTRLSYAYSNRQFKNRLMLTHSTGNLANGWAFTGSASNRSGNLYVPGTYIQASSFYFAADKRINEKHLLSISALFAPTERAGSGTEQHEVYELCETSYYNARWGFQHGKARNASIRKSARPVFFISHTYQPNKGGQWNSSIAYTLGKTSISGLNWNQSPNPNPDYYRYLPSYYYTGGDTLMGNQIKNDWKTDLNTQQINWDELIKLNQANLYSLPSPSNNPVNTSETRARYVLENRIEALQQISFNTTYLKRIGKLFSSTGFNATYYSNRKYKEVEDLLGASFWLDYDQFAQGLGIDPNIQQNNLDAPDKKIYEGDRFGYDYRIHIRKAELWTQMEYKIRRVDLYAGASVSGNRVWRESYMANGKFPSTSKGQSEKINFINYGFKAGATFKLSGRQFFTINGTHLTRPTTVNNLFIAPDVRNDLVTDLKNEKTVSTDLNYLIKASGLKFRFTVYFTKVKDLTWLKTYWSDVSNTFINYIMTGVNQQQKGIELGLEKTIFISHNLQCAFGFGNFSYSNRPTAQAWQSNNNAALFSNRTIYLNNYKLGGSPQLVAGFGYRYMSVRRFNVGLNLNYFDQIYAEINPDKRTREGLGIYNESELDLAQKVLAQEELPAYYILNANIGKSFRLRKNSGLNVQLSVNNLLNRQNNKLFAAEQLRWDPQYPDRFQNKYTYMTGRTYMAQITMNF